MQLESLTISLSGIFIVFYCLFEWLLFLDDDVPGLPSFEDGLGGEADRPKGGGVLVLGLESGVRGILGLETKGDLNVDLPAGG